MTTVAFRTVDVFTDRVFGGLDAVKRARVRREPWDPMFAGRNAVGVFLFAHGAETPEGDLFTAR